MRINLHAILLVLCSVCSPYVDVSLADHPALSGTQDVAGGYESSTSSVDSKRLAWKFKVSKKVDINGVEVPEADIILVVKGEEVRIGKFLGYPVVVKKLKGAGIPEKSILACKTWFGGEGEEIFVRKKKDSILEVLSRHIDEGDTALPPVVKIMEIKY